MCFSAKSQGANCLTGPFQGPCLKTECTSHDVGFYNSKVISRDSFLANEKIVSPLFFLGCVFDDNNKEVLHFALARNFKFVSIVLVIFQSRQKELGDKFNLGIKLIYLIYIDLI